MSENVETTRAKVAAGDGMVRALLTERAGLLRAGKAGRVAQVDEQLRLRGYPTDDLPGAEPGAGSGDQSGVQSGEGAQAPQSPPRGRRAPKPDRAADAADTETT